MVSRLLVAVVAVLSLAGFAAAAEYPCPSDPGFCYLDVDSDGCFDEGTDDGPLDDRLSSGSFPPDGQRPDDSASIVCPPSVRELRIAPTERVTWLTGFGGHILLFGTTIRVPRGGVFVFYSHGDAYVGGPILGPETGLALVSIRSDGDLELADQVRIRTGRSPDSHLSIESSFANIRFGRRVAIESGNLHLIALGTLDFGDSANVRGPGNLVAERVEGADLRWRARKGFVNLVPEDELRLRGRSRFAVGHLQIWGGGGPNPADVEIENMKFFGQHLRIRAVGSLALRTPDVGGETQRSLIRFRPGPFTGGPTLHADATEGVDINATSVIPKPVHAVGHVRRYIRHQWAPARRPSRARRRLRSIGDHPARCRRTELRDGAPPRMRMAPRPFGLSTVGTLGLVSRLHR